MTNDEAIKFLKQIYPYGCNCWLDEQRTEAIGKAIEVLSANQSQDTAEEQNICLDAMKSWGEWENFGILAEESGEMLSAINKLFRGRASAEDVITELADVSLVITAFAMYFGYDKYLAEKDRKLQRLKGRLEEWHNKTGK